MPRPDHSHQQAEPPRLGRVGERSSAVLLSSIAIRAGHQVGAAIFLTYYLLGTQDRLPLFATILALTSGVALVATEWLRHRQLFREVAGLVTLGKCMLLGAAVHGVLPGMPTVLLAFVLASMGAHAPKQIRHRLLF